MDSSREFSGRRTVYVLGLREEGEADPPKVGYFERSRHGIACNGGSGRIVEAW
mgnify:CR=1 FL=1